MRPFRRPRLEPLHPREARATRAAEVLLSLAAVASLVPLLPKALSEGPLRPESRGARTPSAPSEPWTSMPVDVARDGRGRLRLLPGLGSVRAGAVLADRQRNGPVTRVEDLVRVRGLGRKTIDALLRAGAVVGPSPAARVAVDRSDASLAPEELPAEDLPP